MNKIINGRKYDSRTAAMIYSTWRTYRNDKWTELYLKKNGEFFLEYHTTWEGDESTITPLTDEEAREACMNNLDADEYEAIWGEVEE